MQRSVDRRNRRSTEVPLAMRIGISAGDASFEDRDRLGTPVVEASRLCAAAEGRQILVSDLVLGERLLKELPEPVLIAHTYGGAPCRET